MKIKFLLSALLALLFCNNLQAADSLKINLNRQNFVSGDTILWDCELQGFEDSYKLTTLQVIIEDVKSPGHSWQYRFPIVSKKAAGSIHITTGIPDGKYAVNFLLQKEFFSIRGRASYYPLKDTAIDYIMVLKNKQTIIRNSPLQAGGRFAVNHLIFEDTAMFAFSAEKSYENFRVRISTPLDSAFEPVATVTKIIRISQISIADPRLAIPTAADYAFDYKTKANGHLLDNVTVKAKRKKAVEEYADKYVSGSFKSISDMTFDGLEDEEISRSIDVFNFLQAHVAGLTFTDGSNGSRTPSWRGSTTDIYLDEIKIEPDQVATINTEDIAMVKVFRPGSTPLTGGAGSGQGGAIAVYTKKGNYSRPTEKGQETRYKIFGYNPLDLEWR